MLETDLGRGRKAVSERKSISPNHRQIRIPTPHPTNILKFALVLRVRPPGIEWKTGRNPKMGKNWTQNGKWPSARNGEKMAQNWRKNGLWGHFSIFSPFLGHFFPISGRGPFSIFCVQFFPIFGFRPVFHSTPGGLTRNLSDNPERRKLTN